MVAVVSGNSLGLNLTSLSILGERGIDGAAAHGSTRENVYVNVANGNLVLSHVDDYLAAHGADIGTVRTYNSQGTVTGDASGNWRTGALRLRLEFYGDVNSASGSIVRVGADGARATYQYDAAAGHYLTTDGDGAHDTIRVVGDDFIRTDGSTGDTETYSSTGRLLRQRDTSGNLISYAYHTDGDLQDLLRSVSSDVSGETVEFEYAADRTLTRIRTLLKEDAQTRTVSRVSYEYDAQKRLSRVSTDLSPEDNSVADGRVYTTVYTYDGASDRIASVNQSDGHRISMTYAWDGENFRVASFTNGVGQVTRFSYDVAGRRTAVTDALNIATVYEYDRLGQLESVTRHPDSGTRLVTRFSYNDDGDLIRIADPSGRTTELQYDANGNQILQRDSAGNTVSRTFDGRNQLVTETSFLAPDADGPGVLLPSRPSTIRYVRDEAVAAHVRFSISAEGRVTEYRYDSYGARTSAIAYLAGNYEIAALGVTDVPSLQEMLNWTSQIDRSQAQRTDMAYDVRGQLEKRTVFAWLDGDGNGVSDGTESVARFTYDQSGLLRHSIDANGGMTSHAFDGLGRTYASTDAQGGISTTTYSDAGKRIETTVLANGLTRTAQYNRAGRLVSVVSAGPNNASLGKTSYVYDAEGRLRMTVEPSGRRSYMLYDGAGRKTADIDPAGAVTEYQYNAASQVARVIRYANATDIAPLIDSAGRAAAVDLASMRPVESALDRISWNVYDDAGRLCKAVDPLGFVTQTDYDGAGRVVRVTRFATAVATADLGMSPTPSDVSPPSSGSDRITRLFHDRDGKLVGRLDAEGYLSEFRYDAGGRLRETISYATAVQSAVTPAGSVEQLRPASSDADVREHRLYDGKGQALATVDPEGFMTELVYDRNGNVSRKIRYATPVHYAEGTTLAHLRPPESSEDQTTSYTYTRLNQLMTEVAADGTVTKHEYDRAGHVILTTRATGTDEARAHHRRYDLLGRATAELSAEGAAKLAGLTEQSAINAVWAAHAVKFHHDGDGRLIRVTDEHGRNTVHYYDDAGRPVFVVNAMGEVEGRTYDVLGQLKSVVHYASRLPGQVYKSLSGGKANVSLAATFAGLASPADAVRYFDHDLAGRVAADRDALGMRTWSYDAFGAIAVQREQISDAELVETRYRHDRRGLLTETRTDPLGVDSLRVTRYDGFGRAIETTDANGNIRFSSYDRLGRLVQVNDPEGGIRRTGYDAFDRILIQTDGAGNAVRYRYDVLNRAITITSEEGMEQTIESNRHGDRIALTDGNGQTTRFSYDRNGRITQTTDALGQAVARQYDNSGRLLWETNGNGGATAFAYDAAGRVLTRTVSGTGGVKLVTKYAYDAQGRVLSVTDPTGIVTRTEYDVRGQVISVTTDPREELNPHGLELRIRFEYDDLGRTLKVTDAENRVTVYEYDRLGRRTAQTVDPDGLSLRTEYTIDDHGNLVAAKDPNGNVRRYVYDRENRIAFDVDPEGAVAGYEYDGAGRITRVVRYAERLDTTGLPAKVAGTYIAERIQSSPRDAVESRIYDGDGRLVFTVDGSGAAVGYELDGNGNAVRTVRYATPIPVGATLTLDEVQNSVSAVAGMGADSVTVRDYDALNRATRIMDGAGAVTVMTYDANGNVVERIAFASPVPTSSLPARPSSASIDALIKPDAARDQRQRFVYDGANRLIASATAHGVDANGVLHWAIMRQEFDGNGNVVSRTEYATLLSSQKLSSTAKQSEVSAWMNSVPADTARDRTSRMVYDNAGRQIYTVDAAGAVTRQDFDNAGNVIRRIAYAQRPGIAGKTTATALREALLLYAGDSANRIEHMVYDAANRLARHVDAEGAITDTRYDGAGNVTAVLKYANRLDAGSGSEYDGVDPKKSLAHDRIERRIYGGDSRLRFLLDGEGYAVETRYDGLGNVAARVQYANRVELGDGISMDGMVAAIQQDDSRDRLDTFEYDQRGYLLRSTDPLGGMESWTYDAAGRKLSFTNKLGATWDYEYDAAGRLVAELAPQVAATTVAYDDQGRLSETATLVRAETRIGYDALGNVVELTEGFGLRESRTTRYEYDAAGRQIRTVHPPVAVYYAAGDALLTNGAAGNAMRVEQIQTPVTSVAYDAFGDAVAGIDTGGNVSRKYHDKRGDVVYEVDAGGYVTGYVRDAFGQVTQLTRFAGKIDLAAFAAGGATTSSLLQQLQTFDATLNRMVRTTYDRAGRAVELREPLSLAWNGTDGYVQQRKRTVNRYDAFGGLVERRVEGEDSMGLEVADAAGARTLYAQDRRGLTIRQFDFMDADNGYVTGFVFDAAGNLLERTEFENSAAFALDADGRWHQTAIPETGSRDRITRFDYDRNNRLVSETQIGAGKESVASGSVIAGDQTVSHGYDAVGNRTWTSDPLGNVSFTYYDAMGRVVALAGPSSALRLQITRLYLATLNTGPDDEGLRYWSAKLAAGASLAEVAQDIINAAPAAAGRTDSEFIDSLYQHAADRDADEEGKNYWLGRLADGETRGVVVVGFIASVLAEHSSEAALASRRYFLEKVESVAPHEQTLDTLIPMTEFRRDADGNIVKRIEHAESAVFATQSGYFAADGQGDRVTRSLFDGHGHETETIDAEGNRSFSSYDVQGRTAKQWQDVTDADGIVRTVFSVMRHDALGRPVETVTAGPTADTSEAVYGVYDKNSNSVALSWENKGWGAADLRVVLDYHRASDTPDGEAASQEFFFDRTTDTRIGVVLRWAGRPDDSAPPVVQSLDRVVVYTRSANGRWVQQLRTDQVGMPAAGSSGTAELVRRQTVYNAFGEAISTAVNGRQKAYFDYDAAGNLWRSNGDDGIARVMLHDIEGHVTSTLTSSVDLKASGIRNAADAMSQQSLAATSIRYDRLGNVTVRHQAMVEAAQPGSSSLRAAYVEASILAQTAPAWIGTNTVLAHLARPLSSWDGNIRMELDYVADSDGKTVTLVQTVPVFSANSGVFFHWNDAPAKDYVLRAYQPAPDGTWEEIGGSPDAVSSSIRATSAAGFSGNNAVQLAWTELSALGSGDIKVEIDYLTRSGDLVAYGSPMYGSSQAASGVTLEWQGAPVEKIVETRVLKKDVNGEWVEVLARSKGKLRGNLIVVRAADDIGARSVLEHRLAGTSNWIRISPESAFAQDTGSAGGDDLPVGALRHFGDALVFGTAALPDGSYEYRVLRQDAKGEYGATESGQFFVGTAELRANVAQLYVLLFDRAPDANGMHYWAGEIDRGRSLEQVAQAMFDAEPARAYYPSGISHEEIVSRVYTGALGRQPTADEIGYWAGKLAGSGPGNEGQVFVAMLDAILGYRGADTAAILSRQLFANKVGVALTYAATLGGDGSVAGQIMKLVTPTDTAAAARLAFDSMSKPSGIHHRQVAQLYTLLFNRAPDAEGMAHWVSSLQSGKSLAAVAEAMIDTAPARAFLGMPSDGTIDPYGLVGSIFRGALGRDAPAPEDVGYWAQRMSEGAPYAMGSTLVAMIDAIAHYNGDHDVAIASQRLFRNKVDVGMFYADGLGGNDHDLARAIVDRTTADDTAAALALAMSAASHAQSENLQLAGLYVLLFDRAPDADGLAWWRKDLQNGRTLAEVAQGMLEASPTLRSMADADLIRLLYDHGAERAPDEDGFLYWSTRLGAVSRGRVVAEFAGSLGEPPAADAPLLVIASHRMFVVKMAAGLSYAMQQGNDIAGARDVVAAAVAQRHAGLLAAAASAAEKEASAAVGRAQDAEAQAGAAALASAAAALAAAASSAALANASMEQRASEAGQAEQRANQAEVKSAEALAGAQEGEQVLAAAQAAARTADAAWQVALALAAEAGSAEADAEVQRAEKQAHTALAACQAADKNSQDAWAAHVAATQELAAARDMLSSRQAAFDGAVASVEETQRVLQSAQDAHAAALLKAQHAQRIAEAAIADRTKVAQLFVLYDNDLQPTLTQIDTWVAQLRSGKSFAQVAGEVYAASSLGSRPDAEAIRSIYAGALEKTVADAGEAYWVEQLANAGLPGYQPSKGHVFISLLEIVSGYAGNDATGVATRHLFNSKTGDSLLNLAAAETALLALVEKARALQENSEDATRQADMAVGIAYTAWQTSQNAFDNAVLKLTLAEQELDRRRAAYSVAYETSRTAFDAYQAAVAKFDTAKVAAETANRIADAAIVDRTRIAQFYALLFNKRGSDLDLAGADYWIQQAGNGRSPNQLVLDMLVAGKLDGLSNESLIDRFYTGALGRSPDADGRRYWLEQFSNIGQPGYPATKGDIILAFLNSTLNYAGSDATALNARALFIGKVNSSLAWLSNQQTSLNAAATQAHSGLQSALAGLNAANATLSSATSTLQTAQATYNGALQAQQSGQQDLAAAQAAYNSAAASAAAARTAYDSARASAAVASRIMSAPALFRTGVEQAYTLLFNKHGNALDLPGVAYWIDKFTGSGWSFSQVTQAMYDVGVPRTTSNGDLVRSIYSGAFGRSTTDYDGIQYWTGQLDNAGRAGYLPTKGDVFVSMIKGVSTYGGTDPIGLQTRQTFNGKVASSESWLSGQRSTLASSEQSAYDTLVSALPRLDSAAATLASTQASYNARVSATQWAQQDLAAKQSASSAAQTGYAVARAAYSEAQSGYNQAYSAAQVGNRIGEAALPVRTEVAQLYALLFNRSGSGLDLPGVDYWIGRSNNGRTTAQLAQDMLNAGNRQTWTNAELLGWFYTQALGRPADQAGWDHWLSQLDNVGKAGYPASRGQVCADFIRATVGYGGSDPLGIQGRNTFNFKVNDSLSWLNAQQTAAAGALQAAHAVLLDASHSHDVALASVSAAAGEQMAAQESANAAQANVTTLLMEAGAARTAYNEAVIAAARAKTELHNTEIALGNAESDAEVAERLAQAAMPVRTEIVQLYALLFNKTGSALDLAGADYWISQRLTGKTLATIARDMIVAGGLLSKSSAQFVRDIYAGALGRAVADSEAEQPWIERLQRLGEPGYPAGHGEFALDLLRDVLDYSGSDPVRIGSRDGFAGKLAASLDWLDGARERTGALVKETVDAREAAKSAVEATTAVLQDASGALATAQLHVSGAQATEADRQHAWEEAQRWLDSALQSRSAAEAGIAHATGAAEAARTAALSARLAADKVAVLSASQQAQFRTRVTQLYVLLYNNCAPDMEGAAYWLAQLAAGNSVAQVAFDMAEAGQLWERETTLLVRDIYAGALERATDDEEGNRYWSGKLNSAPTPAAKGEVLVEFIDNITGYAGEQLASLSSRHLYTGKVSDALHRLSTQQSIAADQAQNSATEMNNALLAARQQSTAARSTLETLSAGVQWTGISVPASAEQTAVAQLYVLLYDRAPDADGLAYWVAQLNAGTSLEQVAHDMADAGHQWDDGPASLVRSIYAGAFGRIEPDDAGELYWIGKLDAATQPPERGEVLLQMIDAVRQYRGIDAIALATQGLFGNKLAVGLAYAVTLGGNDIAAAEGLFGRVTSVSAAGGIADAMAAVPAAGHRAAVAGLYVAMLGKAPDAEGFLYWTAELDAGNTHEAVAQMMLGAAPEVQSLNVYEFVQHLFQNAFGRDANSDELGYWLGHAESMDRGQLAVRLIEAFGGFDMAMRATLLNQEQFHLRVAAALKEVLATVETAAAQAGSERDRLLADAAGAAHLAAEAAALARTLGAAADAATDAIRKALPFDDSAMASGVLQRGGMLGKLAATSVTVSPTVYQTSDRWGNVLSVTDPRNAAWSTRHEYNSRNQVVRTAQSGSNGDIVMRTVHDALGRQIATVDANGNINTLRYDAQGKTVQESHADGGVVNLTYDALGNRTSRTNTLQHTTSYEHDKLGRLVASTGPAVTVYQSLNQVAPDFDEDGGFHYAGLSVFAEREARALIERYRYDELGRRISQTDGAGYTVKSYYDLAGNLAATSDAGGGVTLMRYDAHGRKIAQTDGAGRTMRWQYDSITGKLASQTDLSGSLTVYEHDHRGQLVRQSSDRGQDIRTSYNSAGQVIRIEDKATGTVVTYAYDAAGRRLREKTVKGSTVLQDNHLAYDAAGRLRLIADGRYTVRYDYDQAGNRSYIRTSYIDEAGQPVIRESWNRYDAMHRQTIVNGVRDVNGKIVRNETDRDSHELVYDGEGNRIIDRYYGARLGAEGADGKRQVQQGTVEETYRYDKLNRLQERWRDGLRMDVRGYDAAGRMVQSGLLEGEQLKHWSADLQQLELSTDTHWSRHDAAGRLQEQVVRSLGGGITQLTYEKYDRAGNLQQYTASSKAQGTRTYSYQYEAASGYQLSRIDGVGNGSAASTVQVRDVNGHLIRVEDWKGGAHDSARDRHFDNDIEGRILRKNQDGRRTTSLIVNGEQIGSSGTGREEDGFNPHVRIDAGYGSSPTVYTVEQGQTLRGIARAVWGDGTLWYLIADANGIGSDAELTPGQTITIPGRSTVQHNSADSFRPYDAASMIGDTTPTLPNPGASGGCGAVGQLIMIVVAVVVTFFTAGAMSGAAGSMLQVIQAGATMATGASLAVGAAIGSIASQVVGNAIGAQDGFSWKQVAMSAVSGGIGAGMAGVDFTGSAVGNAVVRSAIGNVASQGIAIAVGAQSSFNWRAVAASAVGGGIGQGVTQRLATTNLNPLAARALSSLAGGSATMALRGGQFDAGRVAVDVFGNVVGNSIVYGDSGGSQQTTELKAALAPQSSGSSGAGAGIGAGVPGEIDGHALEMARLDGQATTELALRGALGQVPPKPISLPEVLPSLIDASLSVVGEESGKNGLIWNTGAVSYGDDLSYPQSRQLSANELGPVIVGGALQWPVGSEGWKRQQGSAQALQQSVFAPDDLIGAPIKFGVKGVAVGAGAVFGTIKNAGSKELSVVLRRGDEGVKSVVFENQLPNKLQSEMTLAVKKNIAPISPVNPAFDEVINQGTIKYAVTPNGQLMVMPKYATDGTEISHAVLTGGKPVISAGEAEVMGNAIDGYFAGRINTQSGHFLNGISAAQDAVAKEVAKQAFARYGIAF